MISNDELRGLVERLYLSTCTRSDMSDARMAIAEYIECKKMLVKLGESIMGAVNNNE